MPIDYLDRYNEYRQENLKNSIYTLVYSKYKPSLFKAVKRIMSIGIMLNDPILITKSYRIINSQYGELYVIGSELKTILKVISLGVADSKIVSKHIEDMLERVQNIIFIKSCDVYDILKMILVDRQNASTLIELVISNINSFLNTNTMTLLSDVLLYPLPPSLIPKKIPF